MFSEKCVNGYLNEIEYKSELNMPLKSVQNGDFTSF